MFLKSMSQEIIQEKKDVLEAHWSTILRVSINHQLMKYLLVAQTSESVRTLGLS